MIRVVICGAAGRMGRENISLFSLSKDVEIIGAVEARGSKYIGHDAGRIAGLDNIGISITANLEDVIQNSDVIVDFTGPDSTIEIIKIASKYGKGMVIGTTGFSSERVDIIKNYSENIPIFISPNMSQGVNILMYLVKKATELLGEDYEVEITEVHHNRKKDAPSGTALSFGEVIAQSRGTTLDKVGVFGRQGITGERKKHEIGISSIRLSDVVGDHSIIFGGPGERIEFIHKSSSRKTYASGALRAVKFIAQKKKGLYTMKDMLGIE
jgi:4-hydroxy-tetrahydrodipicolinate reductase